MALTLNEQRVDGPPVPAASVVLLRPASRGFEVLLIQRNAASGVLGGAWVFPGGKVDEADHLVDAAARSDRSAAELHAALGEPAIAEAFALAIHVAAIRELAEEAGIVLADGGIDLAAPGVRLRTSALVPWSRWITPVQPTVMRRRFDTRFFVARVGRDIEVCLDRHEAVHETWLAPAEALERYWQREIDLAAPQLMSLVHLARHDSIDSVLDDARAAGVRLIEPHVAQIDGLRTTCYPGDPLHPVRERCLPGPTRLSFREGRFEPREGFTILLRGDA